MKIVAMTAIAAALLACAPSAFAAEAEPLTECVQLSAKHRGTRAGANSQLLLQDGEAYYRVDFRGSCDALAKSSIVHIAANGQDNLLCPSGTAVRSRMDSCTASAVSTLDEDTFKRELRRNRFR